MLTIPKLFFSWEQKMKTRLLIILTAFFILITSYVPITTNAIESDSASKCDIYDELVVKNVLEENDPVVKAFREFLPNTTYFAGGIDQSDPLKRTIEYKYDDKNVNIKLSMYVCEIGTDPSDCYVPLHYEYKHQDGDEFLSAQFYDTQQTQAIQVIDSYSITSPYEQLRHDIEPDDVKCRLGFQKITKHNGTPACVSSYAKEKLINRGWALGIPSHSYKIIEDLKRPQDVSDEQAEFVKNLVLLDARVSGFVDGKDWGYSCCGYLVNEKENPRAPKVTINFFDYEDKKQLVVVFDLNNIQIVRMNTGDLISSGVPPKIESDIMTRN